MTATKVFRVAGMTDEITQCELCGRPELRGTVQMLELDADGNAVADHYFGTSCAAKAAGWTQKKVQNEVKAAAVAKFAAKRAEEDKIFGIWLLDTYQTTDRGVAAKLAGVPSAHLFGMFRREFERCI